MEGIFVQHKTLSHRRKKGIVQQKIKIIVQQKTKVIIQYKTKVIVQQKIKVSTKSHTLTKTDHIQYPSNRKRIPNRL
jgi:hypothetical protein